jgi:hypothetical protein
LDPDKKVGGYQITLPNPTSYPNVLLYSVHGQKDPGYEDVPNPAGGILDRLPCRLSASRLWSNAL